MRISMQMAMLIAVALTTTAEAQQNSAAAKASANALKRLQEAGIIDVTADLQGRVRRQRTDVPTTRSTASRAMKQSGKPSTAKPRAATTRKPASANSRSSMGVLSRFLQRDTNKTEARPKPKLREADPNPNPRPGLATTRKPAPGLLDGFLARKTPQAKDKPGVAAVKSTRSQNRNRSWGRSRLNAPRTPSRKIVAEPGKPQAPDRVVSTRVRQKQPLQATRRPVDELQRLVDQMEQKRLPLIRPKTAESVAQSKPERTSTPLAVPANPKSSTATGPVRALPTAWGDFENPFTTRVTSETSAPVRSARSSNVRAPEPRAKQPVVKPAASDSARKPIKPSTRNKNRTASLPTYEPIRRTSTAIEQTGSATRPQSSTTPAVHPATLTRITAIAPKPTSSRPALGPTPSPAVQAARKLSREQKAQQIAQRETLTGFKGFCPVQLRDNRLLLTSKRQYSSKYSRRVYYFSSIEAVRKFELNPLRYVPANGGRDVVMKDATGRAPIGKLDHAAWYDGRLFLFATARSVNRFNLDPSRYAGPVTQP